MFILVLRIVSTLHAEIWFMKACKCKGLQKKYTHAHLSGTCHHIGYICIGYGLIQLYQHISIVYRHSVHTACPNLVYENMQVQWYPEKIHTCPPLRDMSPYWLHLYRLWSNTVLSAHLYFL